MKTFYQMGLPPYYGFITASIIGYFISTLVCIHFLRKKYNIQFEDIIRDFIDVMIASFLMIFCLFLLKFLVPVYLSSRVLNMFIILLYGVVGIIIYFLYGNRSGLIKRVLGKDYFKFLKELLFINNV
jgi:peptidoglycan biosynthesis protein MviN/MurJ (putative lipid II flippase)